MSSPAGRLVALLAWGALVPAVSSAQAVPPGRQIPPPAAAAEDMSDDAEEGVDSVRIENEHKLGVPDDLVEQVWAYLERRYTGPLTFLGPGWERFAARSSDEYFLDRYFDTPDLWLLAHKHGLRHRSRAIPGDLSNRKNGRQLMQLKLSGIGGDSTSRGEIKFHIHRYDPTRRNFQPDDDHPVIGLVKRSDRPAFRARLAALGLDPESLAFVLDIEQHRRRVYVVDADGVFASLTLDQATGRRAWMHTSRTEIELELNEIRYTAADSAGREHMRAVNERIRADLVSNFPRIIQDQTPKYNKMFAALSAEHPVFRPLVFASFRTEELAAGFALGAFLLALAGRWLFLRLRGPDGETRPPASRLGTARDWNVRYSPSRSRWS